MGQLNKIREVRNERGFTIATLAAAVGLSPSAIEKMEKGQRRLKLYQLTKVAEVLCVEVNFLANGQVVDTEPRVTANKFKLKKQRTNASQPIKNIPKTVLIEPMGLRKAHAAAFCGISVPTFEKFVFSGALPNARYLGSIKIWIKDELTTALTNLPYVDGDPQNPLDFLLEQ